MDFVLSEKTAQNLRELLRLFKTSHAQTQSPVFSTWTPPSNPVQYVKCGTETSSTLVSHVYNCRPQLFNGITGVWDEQNADCLLVDADFGTLESGKYYQSVRYGMLEGIAVYVASVKGGIDWHYYRNAGTNSNNIKSWYTTTHDGSVVEVPIFGSQSAGFEATTSRIVAMPFLITRTMNVDQVALFISFDFYGELSAYVGIYDSMSVDDQSPFSLKATAHIVNTTPVLGYDGASPSRPKAAIVSLSTTLSAGLYWLAFRHDDFAGGTDSFYAGFDHHCRLLGQYPVYPLLLPLGYDIEHLADNADMHLNGGWLSQGVLLADRGSILRVSWLPDVNNPAIQMPLLFPTGIERKGYDITTDHSSSVNYTAAPLVFVHFGSSSSELHT